MSNPKAYRIQPILQKQLFNPIRYFLEVSLFYKLPRSKMQTKIRIFFFNKSKKTVICLNDSNNDCMKELKKKNFQAYNTDSEIRTWSKWKPTICYRGGGGGGVGGTLSEMKDNKKHKLPKGVFKMWQD